MLQGLAPARPIAALFGPDRVLRVVCVDPQPQNICGHVVVRGNPVLGFIFSIFF